MSHHAVTSKNVKGPCSLSGLTLSDRSRTGRGSSAPSISGGGNKNVNCSLPRSASKTPGQRPKEHASFPVRPTDHNRPQRHRPNPVEFAALGPSSAIAHRKGQCVTRPICVAQKLQELSWSLGRSYLKLRQNMMCRAGPRWRWGD